MSFYISTVGGLDTHRTTIPIDHPDSSITRTKLEYPTVDVSFAYLAAINRVVYSSIHVWGYIVLTKDSFTDKAVWTATQVNTAPTVTGRYRDYQNMYFSAYVSEAANADHVLFKISAGTLTSIATEAIDIDDKGRGLAISCSGSTIKSLRYEMLSATDPLALPVPSATISATDTTFASGLYGFRFLREVQPHGGNESGSAWLKAPLTPLPPAQAILELDIEGSGKPDDPFRPSTSKNLVEVTSLTGLPDFLYQEAKRYQLLKNKGFTDEEIQVLLGYIPQHQVDLDSVTWGAIELHPDKASTAIITITGDNPNSPGAIDRQKTKAKSKRVFTVPKDYNDAVALYNQLRRDHPYWLAGKDNFAYQVLGWEELDLMQNVDFYYGEFIDHKTHYRQLKQVPDFEIRNSLNELIEKLSRVTVLADERDKHISKAKEILSRGW